MRRLTCNNSMAYIKNWTDNFHQIFFMGTSWVAVSINNITTRASRRHEKISKFSILMGWTLPSTGMWRARYLPSLIALLSYWYSWNTNVYSVHIVLDICIIQYMKSLCLKCMMNRYDVMIMSHLPSWVLTYYHQHINSNQILGGTVIY